MNASALMAGEHYAWIPNRGRDENVHIWVGRVKRVKLIRTYRVLRDGNTSRRTTMAKIEVLELNGSTKTPAGYADSAIINVPAREIVETWDEYYGIHEEKFIAREERERKEAERHARQEEQRERLSRAFTLLSIPVHIGKYTSNVSLSLDQAEKILSTHQETQDMFSSTSTEVFS